jgi:hypothetical protein
MFGGDAEPPNQETQTLAIKNQSGFGKLNLVSGMGWAFERR